MNGRSSNEIKTNNILVKMAIFKEESYKRAFLHIPFLAIGWWTGACKIIIRYIPATLNVKSDDAFLNI